MARLHEHQGKALLAKGGIATPRGSVARSGPEAAEIARTLAGPVVVKVQAFTTGRAAAGGVAFANSADEAAAHAERMLEMRFGLFPVTEVLVEERLQIAREFFVSVAIDERERAPVILLSATGGSGVEERAAETHRVACHVTCGPDQAALRAVVQSFKLDTAKSAAIEQAVRTIFDVARSIEARSLEVNPLVITADGRVMAADCRVAIDDYAVVRHPELDIEIAREMDHPPTELERVAYAVEQQDHRGTFFFAQMNTAPGPGSKGLVGFHGAGGGGSMMSMDAVTAEGFTIANFCDTSGNPSPAKVYRAARIILSQPGIIGYFGSGSGVANQEQYWSAYGLAKAFWELDLDIPTVIRLGGNAEDRAVEVLQGGVADLRAPVEGYRKTDPPAKVAARFAALVAEDQRQRTESRNGAAPAASAGWAPRTPRRPTYVGAADAVSFEIRGGRVWIDAAAWREKAPAIIARSNGLLRDDNGRPTIAVKPEQFAAADSDLIACEVECRRDGIDGIFVELALELPAPSKTR